MSQRRRVWAYRALTAVWALLAIPAVLWWSDSVLFVILVSLYANAASSLTASEAADDRELRDRLTRIEALLERRPMSDVPLPFSLAWLAGYEPREEPLQACGAGHLLVAGRSCWAPRAFTEDFRALLCEPVDDCDQRAASAQGSA